MFVTEDDFWQTSSRHPGLIRLDSARNAYGPSPSTAAVLRQSVDVLAEYADAEADALRGRIAECHSVRADQVVLGCGSSEILRMAAQAFTGSGKPLVHALPTCDLIAQYATRCGAELRSFSLTKGYSHDLDSMAAAALDARAGLVYVCNPNSPTGTLTRRGDIEGFLSALPPSVYVVVDEAHHNYVPRTLETLSFLDRRVDDDRVIVVRSFSNLYRLAGLRVGYTVTTRGTAKQLEEHQTYAQHHCCRRPGCTGGAR